MTWIFPGSDFLDSEIVRPLEIQCTKDQSMAESSDAFELTKSRVDRICGVLQKCQGGVAPGPVTLCLLSMGMSPV